MALIPIGPWKRDSTYRVHPLVLMDSTYRVPLLDSKLVRLHYAWYYRIKSPSGPSSALAALGTPQPSFWTLNAVEPRLTYPNLLMLSRSIVSACMQFTLHKIQSKRFFFSTRLLLPLRESTNSAGAGVRLYYSLYPWHVNQLYTRKMVPITGRARSFLLF